MRYRVVATVLVAMASQVADSQESGPDSARAPVTSSVTARDSSMYVAMMKSDLSNLVAAQDYYRSTRSNYASNVEDLSYKVTVGVNLPQIVANADSWSATITHARLAGVMCAVAVGTVNPLSETVAEGRPFCRKR